MACKADAWLQVVLCFVVACGAAIMGLHAYIVHKFPRQQVPSEVVAKAQRLAARKRERERRASSLGSAGVALSSAGGATPSLTLDIV